MKRKLILVLAALIIGVLTYNYRANQPTKVLSIQPMPNTGELRTEHVAPLFYDSLPEGYRIVDVRSQEEYEKEHTEDTFNVPLNIFEEASNPCEEVISKLPEGKIIFICPFGPRAKEMYEYLTDSKEDMGCGLDKDGLYHLWAKVKFKQDRLIIQNR